MFSRRFHRYSQMFLRKQKSVLIRVICGVLPFKQDMNVLPQISQMFLRKLKSVLICVICGRIPFKQHKKGPPTDFADLHRYSLGN